LSYSTLVIGYGSIGRRHAKILQNIKKVSNIYILTNQNDIPYKTIDSLEKIIDLNPDYIVIASSTSKHFSHLKFLVENLSNKKILVEKPLFNSNYDLDVKNNKVFVGYNLRFHPILQKIKSAVFGKKIWNVQIFCGSYLPDWRSKKNYRLTSSAKKKLGGGVLLDLSHELDYTRWFFQDSSIHTKYVVNEKISNLEIDSDDILLFSGLIGDKTHIHISLNYFTRKPARQILLDGENISIQANLIENTLSIIKNTKTSNFSYPNMSRNDSYKDQHNAILSDDLSNLCTYTDGRGTLEFINTIKNFKNN
tara:strand:+ start:38643 stop:39563 length:921 start_codon:yes stop_codon:yes gene_type:complete